MLYQCCVLIFILLLPCCLCLDCLGFTFCLLGVGALVAFRLLVGCFVLSWWLFVAYALLFVGCFVCCFWLLAVFFVVAVPLLFGGFLRACWLLVVSF